MASRWEIPGPAYFDASALIKIYLSEPGSQELNRSVRGRRDLIVSDLGVTELTSALARRLRGGALPADKAVRLHEMVLEDLSAGFFERVLGLDSEIHRQAERLLFLTSVALRSADALHLALATAGGASSIITFDVRQREAAREVGLRPVPEIQK